MGWPLNEFMTPTEAITISLIGASHLFSCLGEIESGNNDRKVGAHREVSRYQILPSEWKANCKFPLRSSTDSCLSRIVATIIQSQREAGFIARHDREPTIQEWYALWNAPSQAMRGKLSKSVKERCERFENLVLATWKENQSWKTTTTGQNTPTTSKSGN